MNKHKVKCSTILLVHREKEHNLGSSRVDRLFIRRIGKEFRKNGFSIQYTEADDLQIPENPRLILSMCRSSEIGMKIQSACPNVLTVNVFSATKNTLRHTLYPILEQSGFPFPETDKADINDIGEKRFPFWVKRMDYHHLHRLDVAFVDSTEAAVAVQKHFYTLGIGAVYIQEHCPGERHKFYAIRDRRDGRLLYFVFRHEVSVAVRNFVQASLPSLMDQIGLEIFGGDVIVTPKGEVRLVDINAWPSFKGFQHEATKVIVNYCQNLLE